MVGMDAAGALNLKLPVHPRISVKKFGFVQGGWRQKLQYIRFLFFALYWTWWWRPSWIYASETLSCPVVWLVKKLTNINVVYHEHDLPSLDRTGSWFMNAALGYRAKLARDAELCVLPEQARLLEFLETTKRTKPAFCVWNCPRLDEIAHLNSDQGPGADHLLSRLDHKCSPTSSADRCGEPIQGRRSSAGRGIRDAGKHRVHARVDHAGSKERSG